MTVRSILIIRLSVKHGHKIQFWKLVLCVHNLLTNQYLNWMKTQVWYLLTWSQDSLHTSDELALSCYLFIKTQPTQIVLFNDVQTVEKVYNISIDNVVFLRNVTGSCFTFHYIHTSQAKNEVIEISKTLKECWMLNVRLTASLSQ